MPRCITNWGFAQKQALFDTVFSLVAYTRACFHFVRYAMGTFRIRPCYPPPVKKIRDLRPLMTHRGHSLHGCVSFGWRRAKKNFFFENMNEKVCIFLVPKSFWPPKRYIYVCSVKQSFRKKKSPNGVWTPKPLRFILVNPFANVAYKLCALSNPHSSTRHLHLCFLVVSASSSSSKTAT